MPYAFVIYPTPVDATVTLTPDSGGSYTGVPYTHTSGRQGQVCYVSDGTPDEQGTTLNVSAPNYLPERLRGFLVLDAADELARLEVDDVVLELAGAPAPTPPPAGSSPLDIINHVYATTQPQLWTLEGCGKFTEDCCDALHAQHSAYWGHVKKNPGQNQYQGHAVDAVMLALNVPGTAAGIYDIIYSSVSPEAKPAFNFAGPPEYDLWMYPAEDATKSTPVLVLRVPPDYASRH
jgi:hypothetical protein